MKQNSQVPVLLGFLGVLLAVLVFFTVYNPYIGKTEELESENQALLVALSKYQEIAENEVYYKETIQKYEEETKNIVREYAYGLSREDQVMYIANMKNRFSSVYRLNYFNMGTDQEILYDNGNNEEAIVDTTRNETVGYMEPQVVDNDIHMFVNTIDTGYEVSYEGIKEMLDYINEVGVKRNITSMSLTFDSTSGLLAGSMSMNQYYLTGTDGVYSSTTIPTLQTGLENIFGTVDVDYDETEAEE